MENNLTIEVKDNRITFVNNGYSYSYIKGADGKFSSSYEMSPNNGAVNMQPDANGNFYDLKAKQNLSINDVLKEVSENMGLPKNEVLKMLDEKSQNDKGKSDFIKEFKNDVFKEIMSDDFCKTKTSSVEFDNNKVIIGIRPVSALSV